MRPSIHYTFISALQAVDQFYNVGANGDINSMCPFEVVERAGGYITRVDAGPTVDIDVHLDPKGGRIYVVYPTSDEE